tara:strand:- start:1628 stop:2134 length:507 start_codon:yes stop_codon:yes gene_type:complete
MGFHLTHRKLQRGDVVQPGSWGGVVLDAGTTHEWFERETLLEAIRAKHYPTKPSRLQSAYYFPDLNHAMHYWVNFAQGDRVYAVQVADTSAPFHHAFMTCLPPVQGRTDEEIAHHYWRKDLMVTRGKFRTATEEILTTSALVVSSEFIFSPELFEDPTAVTVDLSARN